MDIHEIALEFRLPLKKVQRMQRAGVLNLTPTDEATGKIRAILSRGNVLPVLDLLALKRDPAKLDRLGALHAAKAREQLASLGDIEAGALGERAANLVYGAAIMEAEPLGEFARALRAAIPPGGCTYSALASRVLWGVIPQRLEQTNRFMRGAMQNVRKHPDFRDCCTTRDKRTFFVRPEPLDL